MVILHLAISLLKVVEAVAALVILLVAMAVQAAVEEEMFKIRVMEVHPLNLHNLAGLASTDMATQGMRVLVGVVTVVRVLLEVILVIMQARICLFTLELFMV